MIFCNFFNSLISLNVFSFKSLENFDSKIVLKRERPDDYKLYQNNTWDGINLNLLSIDHIKPLHECFKDGWSIEKACRISNLQILSMKENILKENPEAKFNEKRD